MPPTGQRARFCLAILAVCSAHHVRCCPCVRVHIQAKQNTGLSKVIPQHPPDPTYVRSEITREPHLLPRYHPTRAREAAATTSPSDRDSEGQPRRKTKPLRTTTMSLKKTCDCCVHRKRSCDGFASRRCRWVLRWS